MTKALEKRPVSSEAIDAAVARVCHKLRVLGEREVPSRQLGEMAMEELRQLHEVVCVRYASVSRTFEDFDAFLEPIHPLHDHGRKRDPNADQLPLLSREPT